MQATPNMGNGTLWLRHAFLMPTDSSNNSYGSETKRRGATSAAFKFTNTTPGGSYSMNNPPQFTRFADIRHPGRGRTKANSDFGMGRYYSEAIDDTKDIIHITAGVPRFSNWASFFANFYDRNAALLANTGRTTDVWFELGNIGGHLVTLPFQPIIIGVTLTSRIFNFLTRSSPSKWFYFKPTMHSYWMAVNTMANEFAISLGIIPRINSDKEEDPISETNDPGQQVTAADRARMNQMFPDLFRKDGSIDVMSLATRTQRLSKASNDALKKSLLTQQTLNGLRESIEKYGVELKPDTKYTDLPGDARDYFLNYIAIDKARKEAEAAEEGQDLTQADSFSSWSDLKGVYNFVAASQYDGSQFVSFRVAYNSSQQESFSNQTEQSGFASTLNTKIKEGRRASFDLMGGNIVPGLDAVLGVIKSTAAGVLNSINASGLAVLTGTAFVDIPELWSGSTASLPTAEYKIPLPNCYGNIISRFINLYLPIAMVLPLGLPLSAGRSAYTSPFICQVFQKGRVQKQLCIVDSITITRGTGNVGWDADHNMLGGEITISFKDLSSIMHIPIKGSFASGSWLETAVKTASFAAGEAIGGDAGLTTAAALTEGAVWDEQSLFQDYVSTLTSQSFADTYYLGKRLNLNITRAVQQYRNFTSPSTLMSWALDGTIARTLSAFAQTSDRF